MSDKTERKSLYDRSYRGFPIKLQRNAYPRGDIQRFQFTTISELKRDSVKLLDLPSKVKYIFDKDGNTITDENEFCAKEIYYISCGEAFYQEPKSSKKSKKSKQINEEEEDFFNEEESIDTLPAKEKLTEEEKMEAKRKEKKEKHNQERNKQEIASFNRAIAFSDKTVQEVIIESTLSAFASTPQEKQSKLSNYDELRKMEKDTQFHDFINHLIHAQLAPTFGNSELQEEIEELVLFNINMLPIDEFTFIIQGLPQTGKSTLLYLASKIIMRKIQQSSAYNTLLYFPLNAEKITLELDSIKQLYQVIVSTTLTAARYSNFAIAPFIKPLNQWFGTLMTQPVLATFPKFPKDINGIDFDAIQNIGHNIFNILKERDGVEKVLEAMVSFPVDFAKAIGLKNVFFVIDNFEYLDVALSDETMFPDSFNEVKLAPIVCKVVEQQKYLISCQSEALFSDSFTCENATPIDTEGIIKNFKDGRKLRVMPSETVITLEDCKGCPGIISLFEKVLELAKDLNKDPVQKKKVKLQTIVQKSRKIMFKKQLIYLINCLVNIENNKFTHEKLNIIDGSDITVTVEEEKEPEPKKEEAEDRKEKQKKEEKKETPKKEEKKEDNEEEPKKEEEVEEPPKAEEDAEQDKDDVEKDNE